jgi:isoleucyl-tRNA synthetase
LESKKRISTIKFLNIALEILLKWFAPVLSFTTEEIYSLLKIEEKESIHLEKFPVIPSNWNNQDLNNKWIELIKIRDKCNSSIELKRASKEIGSSLEANLKILLNDKLLKLSKGTDFSELCITSGAKIDKISKNDAEEISIETNKAEGKKCSVCWKINKDKCERHGDL